MMIVYVENLKKMTPNLLKLTNNYIKVVKYKVNDKSPLLSYITVAYKCNLKCKTIYIPKMKYLL
jgi:hypothetical protein